MTRQTKTPAQRAQEAVGVLERRLTKITKIRATHMQQVTDLDVEIAAVNSRLDYARQNPDLPPPASSTATVKKTTTQEKR